MPKSKPLVLFVDIETNGLPIKKVGNYHSYYPYTDLDKYDSSRIIAISWSVHDFKNNKKVLRTFYIKPDGFTVTNSDIHGITEDKLNNDGVLIGHVFDQLDTDLVDVKVIVAHNLEFDYNVLLSELHRSNRKDVIAKIEKLEKGCTGEQSRDILKIPFQSSYVIAKYKMPRLPELYKFCFNKDMDEHHNPEKDVIHLSECFFHLMKL